MINQNESYLDNPLLRREAGEGWYPDGPEMNLLAAIAVRETYIDLLANRDTYNGDDVQTLYRQQCDRVAQLKQVLGMGNPPLPPIE